MKLTSLALTILTILTSAAIGSGVTWLVMTRFLPAKDNENIPSYLRGDPEDWLLPPDSTMESIFHAPEARDILAAPESITLHERVSGPGENAITYGDYSFSSKGTEVSTPNEKPLLYSVRSISSYGMMTACLFNPVVLMRCTRQGHSLDLLFCFSCNDLRAFPDRQETRETYMGAGITPQGRRAFITYLSRALPSNEALRKLYAEYPHLRVD